MVSVFVTAGSDLGTGIEFIFYAVFYPEFRLIILMKSLIIGGLVGVGVGAGAARMFHAPTVQGMGAFRTLGELNSCEGDPASTSYEK